LTVAALPDLRRVVLVSGAFRRAVLRRRGRHGRYWARRRVPGRLLVELDIRRGELGKRGGGLYWCARRGL